jgi:hypothetical protein
VCAAVPKCGVPAGKKFSKKDEEFMNINICIILPVFTYTSCAIKYADRNRKI